MDSEVQWREAQKKQGQTSANSVGVQQAAVVSAAATRKSSSYINPGSRDMENTSEMSFQHKRRHHKRSSHRYAYIAAMTCLGISNMRMRIEFYRCSQIGVSQRKVAG